MNPLIKTVRYWSFHMIGAKEATVCSGLLHNVNVVKEILSNNFNWDLLSGDAVYCMCDYYSPSQALTHTSPAFLHHPRVTPPPWLSLLCPDLFLCQKELIGPCWAIALHFVPDPPETNTSGVLFICPSTHPTTHSHPSLCMCTIHCALLTPTILFVKGL